jgi:sigma-E factor negative regulatory protein RseA
MENQMDTQKNIREHISALSDGELATSDLELAFAALRAADGEQAWNTYHRIGDVLRAHATPDLSDDFAERLAARLAGEPSPTRRSTGAVAVGAASAPGAVRPEPIAAAAARKVATSS